ncbi:MAG TPA: M13 family metallopeptidase N-terminal domain-containing protein, partial [Sphingomicrobium sp.]|nr:M13 family metallopeptidase N-terminal domain-containing protein [Sphingomicrobium sp.]
MKFKILLASASLFSIVLPAAAQAATPVYGDWGYDQAAMDQTVKPGDDFWAFVNGTWDKKTQIKPDLSSAGPFITLYEKSEKDVRDIVEQLANDPNRTHLGQQIGDFYASFVDQDAIDAAGTAPLKTYLSEIDAVKTRPQLLSLFVKPGFASPVDVSIVPDFKNSDRYSATAGQATLGLPSREYYLSD